MMHLLGICPWVSINNGFFLDEFSHHSNREKKEKKRWNILPQMLLSFFLPKKLFFKRKENLGF
jgi:hypothetical protein